MTVYKGEEEELALSPGFGWKTPIPIA